MGAVTFSIDTKLIDVILKKLPADVFVETGTFNGDTVDSVLNKFKQIYSIELSTEYFNLAKNRFREAANVNIMQGDSATLIRTLLPEIKDRATLFWLDAHWCVADNTAGQQSQCPLIKELESIQHLNQDSMIIIDDARLFLATPPAPHEVSDWPNFTDIVKILFKLSNQHKIIVLNDCILYFPERIQDDIVQYSYSHGTDWLNALDKSRDYDILLKQLIEKEDQIQMLANACEERTQAIEALKKKIPWPLKALMK